MGQDEGSLADVPLLWPLCVVWCDCGTAMVMGMSGWDLESRESKG